MKITGIETIPIQIPIKPKFAIRSGRGGSHLVSPFLLVKIHTDAGIFGLGEVSCTPRWSGEDNVTAAHLIRTYFAPVLESADPTQIDRLYAAIDRAVAGNHFTKAGIEMALWDIVGKAEGIPVYALLGGKVRESVPTKWSVSGVEAQKAGEISSWALEQGFRAMKVKVGTEREDDLARVHAVRETIGPEVKLGVDANGAWNASSAVEMCGEFSQEQIYFVEQPVAPSDLRGLAEVRRRVGLPVIADESVFTADDARLLCDLNAADVFSVYVGKAGGIGPSRQIAEVAEAASVTCTIGSNLELGVGSAAMIHVALATRAVAAEEYPCDIIGPLFYEDDILAEPLSIGHGSAWISDRPGLGVELDDAKVERYRVR